MGMGGGVGMGGGNWFGGGKEFFKEYINQYTISMDVKFLEHPPREGTGLLQTALVYA